MSGKVKRGKGDKRILTYDVLRRPDQQVSFFDVDPRGGRRLIGTTAGGRGSITFTPGPDKGKHTVVASFTLNDIGAEERTVTTFTPPPPTLAAPRGLKAARAAARRARVAGAACAGATGYESSRSSPATSVSRDRQAHRHLQEGPGATAGRSPSAPSATCASPRSPAGRSSARRSAGQPLRALKNCSVRKKRVRCR